MNARTVHASAALRKRDATDSTSGGAARVLAGTSFDCIEGTPMALRSEAALAAVCSLHRDSARTALAHDVITTFESVAAREWSKTPAVNVALWTGFSAARAGAARRCAFAGVVFHDGAAHLAAFGAAGMFVLRRGLLHDITDAASTASKRSKYLRYRIYRNDRLVLTCDHVARSVRTCDVRRIVMASSAIDAACERLLDATPDGGAVVLILQFEGSLPHGNGNQPLHFETLSLTIDEERKKKERR